MRTRVKDRDRLISKANENLLNTYHHLNKQLESRKGFSAQQWIQFWYKRKITYASPMKRHRCSDSRSKSTHNHTGELIARLTEWTIEESIMLDFLDDFGDVRRHTTYTATFLACWLCVFVLPESEDRFIRLETFEVDTLMARGKTFSLAAPILTGIYRGLNAISKSPKPYFQVLSSDAILI